MEKKPKIIFVDDEQKILDAMRRMLYKMREHWDMTFVNSAKEALAIMENEKFNLIISDMKMSEMDGLQLLSIVREKYPNTIRFILSGYLDKDVILKGIGTTDQFLTKPCDPEKLKSAIFNTLDTQTPMEKPSLRNLVSKMETLPTLPDLYTEIEKVVSSDQSSFKDISAIITKDVSMTAKVFQVVNSAYFALRYPINNVQQALVFLGIETIKALILTTGAFDKFTQEEMDIFHIKELYNHSVVVGVLAGKIIESISQDIQLANEAVMAGMLHDIGKLIFIKNKADEYKEIFVRQKEEKIPLYMLENEVLGATHSDLGGYLLEKWGLAESIIKAVAFHHNPLKSGNFTISALSAVYLANILEKENFEDSEEGQDEFVSGINTEYLSHLDIIKFLPTWIRMAQIVKEQQNNSE